MWRNTIGGSRYESLMGDRQTSDNGFILVGHTESYILGIKLRNSEPAFNIILIKTDAGGNANPLPENMSNEDIGWCEIQNTINFCVVF